MKSNKVVSLLDNGNVFMNVLKDPLFPILKFFLLFLPFKRKEGCMLFSHVLKILFASF